jgi:NAD(P)-dependent dehydrogenase (short-subunit alcohol dehydrogenase family)
MKIADSTVLVTGANRGLGKALVEEALRRDAKRVYAGVRRSFVHADQRVTPLTLDVTSSVQIRAAVGKVDALDILINNAGISLQNDLSDRAALERLLAVNLFGTYDVTQAFLPVLARSRSAIVNVLSLASLAAVPFDSLYSISKAAAFSLSQSLRALLAKRGVSDPALPDLAENAVGPSTHAVKRRTVKRCAQPLAPLVARQVMKSCIRILSQTKTGKQSRWFFDYCFSVVPAIFILV